MKKRVIPFTLLAVCTLSGCESSETTTKIAKLQEQVGSVAQQLSDTKKQIDGLQEANQRSVQALENLQVVVDRQNTAAAASPVAHPAKEGDASSTSKKEAGASSTVSCSQVWKQLGQGRNPEAAARALGVPVAAIHACEQKIGRSEGGR